MAVTEVQTRLEAGAFRESEMALSRAQMAAIRRYLRLMGERRRKVGVPRPGVMYDESGYPIEKR